MAKEHAKISYGRSLELHHERPGLTHVKVQDLNTGEMVHAGSVENGKFRPAYSAPELTGKEVEHAESRARAQGKPGGGGGSGGGSGGGDQPRDDHGRFAGKALDGGEDMGQIEKSLSQIESLLGQLVRAPTTKAMGLPEFVHYAHGQIVKSIEEPAAASSRRLKALHTAVALFKDNYSSDEAVNVPVFVEDTTALDEKSTALTTPSAAAGLNPDNQSAFEQGFVAKIEALRALLKGIDDDPDNGSEDEEKRKEPAATKGDGEDEYEEDDEKRKAAAAAATTTKRQRTRKGADISADGTAWPSDLNDPAFTKSGKADKDLAWGRDPVEV
jgi:hypothetical protein